MKTKRRFPPKPEPHYSDRLGGTYENGGLHTVWCLWLKQERDTSFGSFDGGFYHLVGTFCELPETHRAEVDDARWPGAGGYADLRVYTQGNQYRVDELYSYELDYHRPHSVGVTRAREMAACLGAIERKMEQLREQYGYPTSATDWLMRVIRVCGVKRLIYPSTPQQREQLGCDQWRIEHTSSGSQTRALLDQLVAGLWTDTDRRIAREKQEQRAAEDAARQQEQA